MALASNQSDGSRPPGRVISAWRLNPVFVVALLLSTLAVVLMAVVLDQVLMRMREGETTVRTLDTTRAIVADAIQARSLVESYAITGRTNYAPLIQKARADIATKLALLRDLSANDASLQPPYLAFERALGDLLTDIETAQVVRDANPGGLDAIRSSIDRLDGKSRAVGAASVAIVARLNQQLTEQSALTRRAIWALLAAITALLAGIVVMSFWQARALREQAASRTNIEGKAQGLQRELEIMNNRLNVALRSAHVKILGLDDDANIIWATETRVGLLGDKKLPLPLLSLVEDSDMVEHAAVAEHSAVATLRAAIDRALRENVGCEFEMRTRPAGQASRWLRVHISPEDRGVDGLIPCAAVDITDLKRRETSNFWLARELSHRAKNLLAVVQSIVRHSTMTASSPAEFQKRLSGRLAALAVTHDLLVKSHYFSVELLDLIVAHVGQDNAIADGRISIICPELKVKPEAAQNFGMALHELYANAREYGALSPSGGVVSIKAEIIDGPAPTLDMLWREEGGPPITAAKRPGFGTILIKQNLSRSINGRVDLDMAPEGVVCHIVAPLAAIVPADGAQDDIAERGEIDQVLKGRSLLT